VKESQNYNIRWQVKIDEKLKHLEEVLENHIVSRLNRLDKRFWWIIGVIITGIVLGKLL